MEVKSPSSQKHTHVSASGYFSHFSKNARLILVGAQSALIVASFVILEATGLTHFGWLLATGVAFVVAAITAGTTIILLRLIWKPFHDIVNALVLAAGEQPDSAPPNPNTYDDEHGFKKILQTIYNISSKNEKTATKTSEGRMQQTDDPILTGLNNMTTGIVIYDVNGDISYHNQTAPVREGTDSRLHLDLAFADMSDTLDTWKASIPESTQEAEYQWSRAADKLPGEENRRLFDVSASFRRGNDAEFIVTLFDRTNLYMPEEEDLDFISFAAHELRGPITVIRGYLDVLQDELKPVLKEDQVELMQRLTVASNRLTSYINNILNAAKYDRRHMRLHLSEESVQNIYDSISDDMELRAKAQDRLLVTDLPKDLPTVAADLNAVGEVMGNLIDNAIKYSNQGGLIQLTARTTTGFVEITVTDHGIGMPNNVLQNLFRKFYRSHRSRETVAGTGIGLYICKAIVSSIGGTITARSIEGEGSVFSFTLPIYDTVADKLQAGNNSNESLIEHGSGWIKNHSMYRG